MLTVVGLANSDNCIIVTKLAVLLVYNVKVSPGCTLNGVVTEKRIKNKTTNT